MSEALFSQRQRQLPAHAHLYAQWQYEFKQIIKPLLAMWHGESEWQAATVETTLEKVYPNGLVFTGRADCIDQYVNAEGVASHVVTDYKTGRLPSKKKLDNAVRSGEKVQTTSYALLDAQITETRYLSLKAKEYEGDNHQAKPLE